MLKTIVLKLFANITNENKTDPLRAVSILMRKGMGYAAVSATEALQ